MRKLDRNNAYRATRPSHSQQSLFSLTPLNPKFQRRKTGGGKEKKEKKKKEKRKNEIEEYLRDYLLHILDYKAYTRLQLVVEFVPKTISPSPDTFGI